MKRTTFDGYFDGSGKNFNLNMNLNKGYVGLFGHVFSLHAVIKNL